MKRLIFFLCFQSTAVITISAQRSWVVNNPFDQKCFIENRGQFNLTGKNSDEKILYGNWVNGINYYFSTNKFFISYPFKVERTESELETLGNGMEKEEKELKYKTEHRSVCFNFLNANEQCVIIPEEKISEYFNYNDPNAPHSSNTFSAVAYKSIVYQNLYPNIDLVFLFVENGNGLKYYFEVKPGGDINNIKFSIDGLKNLPKLNKNGDLEIPTDIGDFIDRAPDANYFNTQKPLKIKYNLKKNIVSFDCKEYDHSLGIIIDPWLIDPNIINLNRGFDVDYDNWGNVYVYGGNGAPFQLKKYTPAGAPIWTYNFTGAYNYYGDFAVDRKSGSVYIVEGFNPGPGSNVLKLNQAGTLVTTFAGDPNFVEMWRIVFSSCTNQAVIGGGGITMPSDQACYMDTNLTTLNPVNILGTPDCCHDICCLAVDNYGYCYPWFMTPLGDPSYSNVITKVPAATLLPVVYTILPNTMMLETYTSVYLSPVFLPDVANGMNGSTVFMKNLYSYDSFRLKRWNTNTGSLITSTSINTVPDTVSIFWSGITTDPCGDVYIGNKNMVSQYDSTLTFKFNYACPDSVYDVQFGNNKIYASGNGFLASIDPQPLTCTSEALNITVTVNQSTCDSNASATLTINSGGTPPYNILWNTVPPITGTNIYNLQPDTFIVTVTDNSCIPKVFSDTIIITASQVGSNAVLTAIVETNVFTPNADNSNDVFYGFELTTPTIPQDIKNSVNEYEFTVFDRWGTIVYKTQDPTLGWNGKILDSEASEGVYFWVIDIIPQCDPSKTYTYQNNVTLFR